MIHDIAHIMHINSQSISRFLSHYLFSGYRVRVLTFTNQTLLKKSRTKTVRRTVEINIMANFLQFTANMQEFMFKGQLNNLYGLRRVLT